MSAAIGTGWYGDPFQQTPTLLSSSPHDSSFWRIRAGCMSSTSASRFTTTSDAVVAELAEQGPVDADHPRGAVGDQRAALVVDDQAALGLDDDVAQRLRGRARVVGLAADDLEVVEPREQGGEQGEHQDLDDQHPQTPALGSDPHQACARAGSSAVSSRSTTGSTNGVSSTSHTTPARITGSRSPIETTGSRSSRPLMA